MSNEKNKIEKLKFRIACAEITKTDGGTDRHNYYMEEYTADIRIDAQCDKDAIKNKWVEYLQNVPRTGTETYALIATESLDAIHLITFAAEFQGIGTITYTGTPESLPGGISFILPDGALDEQTPFFLVQIGNALSETNIHAADSFIDFACESIEQS